MPGGINEAKIHQQHAFKLAETKAMENEDVLVVKYTQDNMLGIIKCNAESSGLQFAYYKDNSLEAEKFVSGNRVKAAYQYGSGKIKFHAAVILKVCENTAEAEDQMALLKQEQEASRNESRGKRASDTNVDPAAKKAAETPPEPSSAFRHMLQTSDTAFQRSLMERASDPSSTGDREAEKELPSFNVDDNGEQRSLENNQQQSGASNWLDEDDSLNYPEFLFPELTAGSIKAMLKKDVVANPAKIQLLSFKSLQGNMNRRKAFITDGGFEWKNVLFMDSTTAHFESGSMENFTVFQPLKFKVIPTQSTELIVIEDIQVHTPGVLIGKQLYSSNTAKDPEISGGLDESRMIDLDSSAISSVSFGMSSKINSIGGDKTANKPLSFGGTNFLFKRANVTNAMAQNLLESNQYIVRRRFGTQEAHLINPPMEEPETCLLFDFEAPWFFQTPGEGKERLVPEYPVYIDSGYRTLVQMLQRSHWAMPKYIKLLMARMVHGELGLRRVASLYELLHSIIPADQRQYHTFRDLFGPEYFYAIEMHLLNLHTQGILAQAAPKKLGTIFSDKFHDWIRGQKNDGKAPVDDFPMYQFEN